DASSENTYIQSTAWKAIISAAYVFREIENVKKQKGFISADVEYVNHKSARFYVDEKNGPDTYREAYYKQLKNVVKEIYKAAFNVRVGGELKFNTIMTRLGFAYYTSPYKDKELKANKMLLSGGLGYRHKGFFIDLTYVHNINKDADFPYRLQDKANTYASLNQTQGNIAATFGLKF
ncbi:MAG: aromatic hydrocarbon degradation protein, partial [Ferruginibacter sp.]